MLFGEAELERRRRAEFARAQRFENFRQECFNVIEKELTQFNSTLDEFLRAAQKDGGGFPAAEPIAEELALC